VVLGEGQFLMSEVTLCVARYWASGFAPPLGDQGAEYSRGDTEPRAGTCICSCVKR